MQTIDTARLPTHVAQVARRLNNAGPDASADTFLLASYAFEVTIKTIAIALVGALRQQQPDEAYSACYQLVRADGLGVWDDRLRHLVSGPVAAYYPSEVREIVTWLTQRRSPERDPWFTQCTASIDAIRDLLGLDASDKQRNKTIVNLTSDIVLLRNKTKAHGAAGPDFFHNANPHYLQLLSLYLEHCPMLAVRWMHLATRIGKSTRAIDLHGINTAYVPKERSERFAPAHSGVHIVAERSGRAYFIGDLIRTDLECSSFLLPNGSSRTSNAEFIDYASGRTSTEDIADFTRVPSSLPPSETVGADTLDVTSNLWGNLPKATQDYVARPGLEHELAERLLDTNHHVITLHGRGGVGKTSLALKVCHDIASEANPRFDAIVWLSARDIDLGPSGPKNVRNALPDLPAACKAIGKMFGIPGTEQATAEFLKQPAAEWQRGVLFVFDNFETLDGARHVHEFLDNHCHVPNKILITSRERAFKGDWPIEVRGMEPQEAARLVAAASARLKFGPLSQEQVDSIIEQTDGHAYVIKLVVGEMAREKRYVSAKSLLPRRGDIVATVFERSYNKLSVGGRRVFLTCCKWRSGISELALLVVLGMRDDIDVESGVEECVRLSLLDGEDLREGYRYYVAPELARLYGQKKLDSDPDRIVLQQDADALRGFGQLPLRGGSRPSQEELIRRFVETMFRLDLRVGGDSEVARRDALLTKLAEIWPSAWRSVFEFRKRFCQDMDKADEALRRLVEEFPADKNAWMLRAEFSEEVGKSDAMVASLVSAAEAAPRDANLLREVALKLCQFMNAHTADIPVARRGVYLASVRARMEAIHDQLDATGLSRLAWLFLLEKNDTAALRYAREGLEKEPGNIHCQRLVERMGHGYGQS